MTEGTYGNNILGMPINYELPACAAEAVDRNPSIVPNDECARCLGCRAVVHSSGGEAPAVFETAEQEEGCDYAFGDGRQQS
jgi:hypothetical protein